MKKHCRKRRKLIPSGTGRSAVYAATVPRRADDLFMHVAWLRAQHSETTWPNFVMAILEQPWFGKLSFRANAASCLLS